jgi:RNA polymerase sigma factor (sigma-70 family)
MDRLLKMLRPRLERLAREYADPVKPQESTSDLLQETSLRAWEKIDTFQGGETDDETLKMFHVWARQILRRLGMDKKRDRDRQRRKPPGKMERLGAPRPGGSPSQAETVDVPAREPSPSGLARSDELAEQVECALAEMDDQTNATIVRMNVFDGMKVSQIAERLGLPYETARERYWTALRQLQRVLKDWI